MREIILDTETTGLDPSRGDRIVEIGCLELVNRLPSGETFHVYINPERAMSPEAEAVHGISDAFLADKPKFADIVEGFLEFVGSDPLVIHNAAFDMKFLNAELGLVGRGPLDRWGFFGGDSWSGGWKGGDFGKSPPDPVRILH